MTFAWDSAYSSAVCASGKVEGARKVFFPGTQRWATEDAPALLGEYAIYSVAVHVVSRVRLEAMRRRRKNEDRPPYIPIQLSRHFLPVL